ncbi:hypothetical protein CYMTET_20592, partial [Cymbomonas tetramitiformis]
SWSTVLGPFSAYINFRYGSPNDSLVTAIDAEIPGSLVVRWTGEMDHCGPAFPRGIVTWPLIPAMRVQLVPPIWHSAFGGYLAGLLGESTHTTTLASMPLDHEVVESLVTVMMHNSDQWWTSFDSWKSEYLHNSASCD